MKEYIAREDVIRYLRYICKILTARGGRTAAQYLIQENICMGFDYKGKKYNLCVVEVEPPKEET